MGIIQNIELLRFAYESDLLRIINAQLGPASAKLERERTKNLFDIRRKDLLGDAVHITPDLMPETYEVYQSCLDMLGGGLSGDMFVQQSQEYNASIFAHHKKFDLLVHSSLLRDFSEDELRFVFGHELGHVIFEHSRFSVHDILSNTEGISADTANLMFRWSRAAEVSADRVGLFCCGKLDIAVTALFRTSSGLSGIDTNRMLRSFRRQYEELEKQIMEVSDHLSWLRAHPMMPIRFKALELDILSIKQANAGFSDKGFRRVDRQIAGILEAIDVATVPVM